MTFLRFLSHGVVSRFFIFLILFFLFVCFLLPFCPTGSLHIHYGFQFKAFMAFLSMITSKSVSCVFSWALFLLSFCLFYLIAFYCILLYYYALEPCFLTRDRKGVDMNGGKGKRNWEKERDPRSKDLQTSPQTPHVGTHISSNVPPRTRNLLWFECKTYL